MNLRSTPRGTVQRSESNSLQEVRKVPRIKNIPRLWLLTEKRRLGGGAPLPHPAALKFRGQPLYAHQPPDQQSATVAPICVRSGIAPPTAVGQG